MMAIDLFVMAVTAAETAARHVAPMEFWLNRRTHMRKIGLIAVAAALALVGIGGWMEWVTSSSQARLATPTLESVDPTQLTMNAKDLPVAEFVDYTLHFPEHEQ
jgi:negative regulator of sigma E activity